MTEALPGLTRGEEGSQGDGAGSPVGGGRELAAALGRLLLEAAQANPPPWPERDPAEDLDEPAIVRKGRRQRKREGR